ncbi:MAG: prolyl oligopeptidase family serine peptidase [Kiritimatiellae bacterium]|nr:prolyl oligopeptidase family serine peptidase [Kiritimatiellia bacterium]
MTMELTRPESFVSPVAGTLNYRLFTPACAPAARKLPLVLFLHGAGERGHDNSSQLTHGIAPLIRYGRESDDPAILLVPQCPLDKQWVDTPWNALCHTMPPQPSEPMRLALELVESARVSLPVDPARTYVTGISMGGYGTWDAIQRRPELFAAALPICGGGDPATAPRLAHMPIWIFHGEVDSVVPVSRSRDMFKALQAAGGKVRYREYPGVDHDAWTRTYDDTEVLEWLFAQRLRPTGG